MSTHDNHLPNGYLPFVGLCSDYCQTVENCNAVESGEFVASMLKLLPRLYIMATDLKADPLLSEDGYIDQALDEEYYESVRRNIAALIGEDDVYLEVFEEDMKYSDTPVTASISEGLADIFQVLYNFLATVDDATDETVQEAVLSVTDDFKHYWSASLCNVLRALNAIAYR